MFSPDGAFLAAGRRSGTVAVWNIASRRQVAAIPAHHGAVLGLAFSPRGSLLATAGDLDRTARVWRLDGDRLVEATQPIHDAHGIHWSANGGVLAAAGRGGLHLLRVSDRVAATAALLAGRGPRSPRVVVYTDHGLVDAGEDALHLVRLRVDGELVAPGDPAFEPFQHPGRRDHE